MRVLQINVVYGYSSTGVIAKYIASLLKDNNDVALSAADGYAQNLPAGTYPIGSKWEYRFHAHIFTKCLDLEGCGSYWATKRFVRWIDRTAKPDVIHFHNIHGSYLNINVLVKYINKNKIPVVYTLHDCWSLTGHCYHFDMIGCQKWKTGCNKCPLHNSYPVSIGLDNSLRNYIRKRRLFTSIKNLHLVAVSEFIKDAVSQSFFKEIPCTVIHNGVDTSVFYPSITKLDLPTDKPVLLGVSSFWSDQKGLQEMIRLGKEGRFTVVMVGVDVKIKQLLPPKIIAISRTSSQSELASYYSRADVFVNPTYNDSFATVNLESLACGTPVVTYKTGGCPECIDNNTGFVVPRGDYESMLNAIDEILKNGKQSYSESCRARACMQFEKRKCFSKYIDVYSNMIKF